jgi:hypothetical protein
VIWPAGSTPILEDGRRGVDVPGVGSVFEGDTIRAAGGAVDATNWPEIGQEMPDCRPGDGVLELFTVDEVT